MVVLVFVVFVGLGVVLVASIGFTVDFIARRVADLSRNVGRVVAVGLYSGDDASWGRVEQAFDLLRHFLRGLGIEGELVRVRVGGVVRECRDVLARVAGNLSEGDVVELFLTGGPRLLTVSLFAASFMLSRRILERMRIVVYGEGFPGTLELKPLHLVELARIDSYALRILEGLRRGSLDAKSLLEITGLPRSTLYKKLNELRKAGLVVQKAQGHWDLDEGVRQLL